MVKRASSNNKDDQPKRVTSRDVARLAGVSQAHVSRVFSGNKSVRLETVERVVAAANELGYRPNKLARGLISGSSNLVAVVISGISRSPWRAALLESIERELRKSDRQTMLFTSERDEDVDQLVPQILQYRPSGIVIASGTISSKIAENCLALGTPIIQINRPFSHEQVFEVATDSFGAGRRAGEYLISHGHRKIALLGGGRNTFTMISRYKGLVSALEAAGLSLYDELHAIGGYTQAFEVADSYLASGRRPTGIFCTNDVRAFALMTVAREVYGLSIPDDLSVIGFDNVAGAESAPYELTTFEQSTILLSEAVVNCLLHPRKHTSPIVITPKLIERKTVATVAHAVSSEA